MGTKLETNTNINNTNEVFTIREYNYEDKTSLVDLLELNIPKYFAPEEKADFNYYLDHERELYYVLLFNDKIVGGGGINFADDHTTGKISWDILHPDYQGKSLGTKLLKHRINKILSFENILKITVRTSQLAYRFYEKQGFELFEKVKDFWAEGFDLYHMQYKPFKKDNLEDDTIR
jgi:[ribosomal protein S18]-alanine N-acetyltransferase